MIPKRIFYVWGYGERKSRLAEVCIENWREHLPDYEIIEVNEKTKQWFDFDYEYKHNLWFKTVYDLKMWAYVSDYMRVKVIYDHGGIYLDTDVTIYKNLSDLLKYGFFVGQSYSNLPEPSVFGAVAKHYILREMLNFYSDAIWKCPVYVITFILKYALQNLYNITDMDRNKTIQLDDVVIFPMEYFQPFYYTQEFNHKYITKNTYTAHWQQNSWMIKKNLFFLSSKHKLPLQTLLKQMEFIDKFDKNANERIQVKLKDK